MAFHLQAINGILLHASRDLCKINNLHVVTGPLMHSGKASWLHLLHFYLWMTKSAGDIRLDSSLFNI